MFRQSLTKATRTASRASFSTSARTMAGGDTGAPRTGGAASGDAFTKREKGMEDYAIREREKLKAQEILARIAEQEKSLHQLKSSLNEIAGEKKEGEEPKK